MRTNKKNTHVSLRVCLCDALRTKQRHNVFCAVDPACRQFEEWTLYAIIVCNNVQDRTNALPHTNSSLVLAQRALSKVFFACEWTVCKFDLATQVLLTVALWKNFWVDVKNCCCERLRVHFLRFKN